MKTRFTSCAAARGFTLIEIAVVLVILSVVSIGLYRMLISSRESYEQQKVTLEMQQNARVAIEALSDDFRHVSYGKDPTQPSIEYAGPDSVLFIADVMPLIGGAEMIGYGLSVDGDADTPNPNDTVLMKTVSDSSGTQLFHEPQSYGIQAGGLRFRYFNGAGVELANPVPQPELIGEVLIEVTAVEPRAHRQTGNYMTQTLSTTIYPRNLPLTPARSRPSTPVVGPLSVPDCESVSIPWVTPTTNTDGTELPLSDISHFTVYFGTDPDVMSINARVARTTNIWTISGLTGGEHYYVGVTCTSRAGVESYMGRDDLDLISPLVPREPTGLTYQSNPGGAGIRLAWNAVTEFTDGSTITTQLTYHIYRDTYPGVQPLIANLIGEVPVSTWYVDSTLTNCANYYYTVTAEACGNQGAGATEILATTPAKPSCVGGVAATDTETAGEIAVSWSLPTTRVDGLTLPPDEISACRIYYGTASGTYSDSVDVAGAATSHVITGLQNCILYYFNVACVDDCPHLGQLCLANEANAQAAAPCDMNVPAAPGTLVAHAIENHIDLCWPANTTDCDLYGYRVYYGMSPGGPYTGTGAAEGPSPITYTLSQVQQGDSCRSSLSNLTSCQTYAMRVTCVDNCSPPNESAYSPEEVKQTECITCDIACGCVHYLCTGSNLEDVHLEIYSTDGNAHTVTKITPVWTGPANVHEVWAGRPLIKIWDQDGSAGGDGAIGSQPSGRTLNVNDFSVSAATSAGDGLPLMLRFTQGQQLQTMEMTFWADGGSCREPARQIHQSLAFYDFDSGGLGDWTIQSGSWSIVSGELYQSQGASVAVITLPVNWGNYVYDLKLKNTYGSTPYILFRYVDANNNYLLNINTSSKILRFCEYRLGSFYVTAQTNYNFSNGVWYTIRIEVQDHTARAYVDCVQVLEVTDASMPASGKIGLRDYYSRTYFDDIRVAASSALP